MKKFMVRISLVCVVFTLLSSALLAQQNRQNQQPQGGSPGGQMLQGEEYIAMLTERLELNEQQVEEVTALLDEQTVQMQELREKYQGKTDQKSRKAMRTQMLEIRDAVKFEIELLLTEEQLAEYQLLLEEQRKEMEKRRQQQQQQQNQS
jgi:Spy/CpxP family protein refolding chaperone